MYLGRNGAGKSTLMGILTGNLQATEGTVYFNDIDIKQLKLDYIKKLGYMPQQQGLYKEFTAEQFLFYIAALKGVKKKEAKEQIAELLNKVNLYESRRKPLGSFSGGMKQRVLIAQAMLGNPQILIFDEPTAGLDPKERIRIRNLISELSFQKIVLIATHVVPDIEFISKEIMIMEKGHLIRMGTAEQLLEEMKGKVWEIQLTEEKYNEYKDCFKISNIQRRGQRICIRVVAEEEQLNDIDAYDIINVEADLDDLYLYLF